MFQLKTMGFSYTGWLKNHSSVRIEIKLSILSVLLIFQGGHLAQSTKMWLSFENEIQKVAE